MNLQQANFENLLEVYYYGTTAHEAAGYLSNLIQFKSQQQLAALLRNHQKKIIASLGEITLRTAIDQLMKCCSVMEIASLAGFIPDLRGTEFGKGIYLILQNEYVRRYYEEYYPNKIPQLFRYRLEGINRQHEKIKSSDLNRTIIVFLDLDLRFMKVLDDGYLLRMLDSFKIQGYRFSDVIKLINDPEKFINRLLLRPEERDVMSQTLNEFSFFMQFCFDLQKLLAQTGPYPLVQSAMWNHYSYWFYVIGNKLNRQISKALTRFLEWKPVVGDDEEAIKVIQDYVQEAHAALKILTSQQFAKPVDVLLNNAEESKIKTTKPLIQMALDSLDFNATIALAGQVKKHVDIFEIGTPCIKYNGINIVKNLRAQFPDHILLVDLKTADAGEYEATPFYEAGANICTVLGVSGLPTIAGVVKAANKHGAEVQVDLMYVEDKIACARACAEIGVHVIGVPTNFGSQTDNPLADLINIAKLGLNVRLSVVGGIKQANILDVMRAGANIVVVSAAIYGAPSPADAAREIYKLIHVA